MSFQDVAGGLPKCTTEMLSYPAAFSEAAVNRLEEDIMSMLYTDDETVPLITEYLNHLSPTRSWCGPDPGFLPPFLTAHDNLVKHPYFV